MENIIKQSNDLMAANRCLQEDAIENAVASAKSKMELFLICEERVEEIIINVMGSVSPADMQFDFCQIVGSQIEKELCKENMMIMEQVESWIRDVVKNIKSKKAEIFLLSDDEVMHTVRLGYSEALEQYDGTIDFRQYICRKIEDTLSCENANKLYLVHENLVHSVAWEYYRKSCVEFHDLKQLAAFGFINAERNYNPKSAAKFTTFAVTCMQNQIKQHLRMGNAVSRSAIVVSFDARAKGADGAERVGLENLDCAEKDELHQVSTQIEDIVVTNEIAKRAMQIIEKRLKPQEQKVFLLKVFGDLSQNQIARRLGISQASVSKTLAECRTVLQYVLGSEGYE